MLDLKLGQPRAGAILYAETGTAVVAAGESLSVTNHANHLDPGR